MPTDTPSGEPEPTEREWPARRILAAVVASLVVGAFVTLLVVGLRAAKVDTSIDTAIARGELKEAPEFTLPVLANGDTPASATASLSRSRSFVAAPSS